VSALPMKPFAPRIMIFNAMGSPARVEPVMLAFSTAGNRRRPQQQRLTPLHLRTVASAENSRRLMSGARGCRSR